MPEYRHYRLDGAGNITSAEWLKAADDAHVVRLVSALKLPVASEIWNGSRLVARIEPGPPE